MKLILSPDPFLEKQVKPFDFSEHDANQIYKEMTELMIKQGGIGISANQVGLDAQIFVIQTYLTNFDEPFAVINPEIVDVSEEIEEMPEGCLSHPELFLDVKRPKSIRVKFLDINEKTCIMSLTDIDARCFLHEYDHLQGIQYTSRVSKLKLRLADKKRKKSLRRLKYGRSK